MTRKALPLLAIIILLGTLLPAPASLAGPPVQEPEPFPFSDRYPAAVLLANPEQLTLLAKSGVDIGNVRPRDPTARFPRPGEPFAPLVATVYINADEAAQLAALGLVAQPINNPSVSDYPGGPTACSGWPAYNTLVARMQTIADNHPNIVRMVNIGTSVQGRTLWMLKITDNPDVEEDEPEFRYASTMHGIEGVGTEMTIRLAELLTENYGSDPYYTTLVDEIEIWLWPVFNPDGYENCTYVNAHGVNLNRDFPDRINDPNNTPAGREPETQAAWYFQEAHTIIMGANYHTGELVANFPWDAVTQTNRYAPDDAIFIEFAEGYTWRNQDMWNNPRFYHGWTRGWEWYMIYGGLQDWAYHWYGEHHVTLEVAEDQPPPYSQMNYYWDMNRDAMLWWMERPLTGARGLVTDLCTGAPLSANVDVAEIGKTVPTDPDVGDYHRLLLPGDYTLIAGAPGYLAQSAGVTVISGPATVRNFTLVPQGVPLYTIQGTVTEAGSGNPLAATVEIVGMHIETQTNPLDGAYMLQVCPGTYTVRASAPRHGPAEREVVVEGNRVENFILDRYDVTAGSGERSGAPGETVTHTLTITNVGTAADSYSLTLGPSAWPAALVQDHVGPLEAGESGAAQVVVQIPRGLLTSTVLFSDVFPLYVTSTTFPDLSVQATGTTYAIADLAVALGALEDSLGGPAGRPLTYTLRLTNTGAYTDSYALAAQGNAWPTTVHPPLVAALGPGASAQVLARVEIPGAPAAPTDTVTIRAASALDDSVQARQTLRSVVLGAAVSAADSAAVGAPGETVTHTLVITNAGSLVDTYAITVAPGDWPAALLTPQVGPLEPGESGAAQVVVRIPHRPLSATVLVSDTFALYVTSTAIPEVGTQGVGVTYAAIVLDVALGVDRASGIGRPGEVLTYTLVVTNTGTYTDSYTLAVLPGNAWPATVIPSQTGWLAPGESAAALVGVIIPAGGGGEADTATVQATSSWTTAVRRDAAVITRRAWCIFVPVVVK